MEDMHKHTTHPDLVKRLKRAEGHLRHVIGMIEGGETCPDIARPLAAAESAAGMSQSVMRALCVFPARFHRGKRAGRGS